MLATAEPDSSGTVLGKLKQILKPHSCVGFVCLFADLNLFRQELILQVSV